MDKQVSSALSRALHGWCTQPGAFTAARNGGAESVLRNAVLGELEVEFSSLAFAEANGVHVDAIVAVSEALPLCFEFKHGMLHRSLLSSIRGDSKSAVGQLLRVRTEARYYLHFIHALECDDPKTGYARRHNSGVFTVYKQFQARADLQSLLHEVMVMLGPVWQEFPISQARVPDARAMLYCWAFRVEEAGRLWALPFSGDKSVAC